MENKKVYIVYRNYGLNPAFLVEGVFASKENALKLASSKLNELESHEKPEYDEWGLCHGVDFTIAEWEVM